MRVLSAEERELWGRVTAEVRAMHPQAEPTRMPEVIERPRAAPAAPSASRPPIPTPAKTPRPGTTLDGSWDRRLARGVAQPDLTIDLHGHTLASAYDALDSGLARATTIGARLVLLVTGKPPTDAAPPPSSRKGGRRGAIRAAVGDWLHSSRHARDIAAVRNAAPRHGGAGALYIVMRRSA